MVVSVVSLVGCHHADMQQAIKTAAAPQGNPVLLAAYQPWFGRPGHINVGYSSQDPAVLEKQIAQARQLGIRGFVVNWYGRRHTFEDKAYGLMQEAAAKRDFQTALMYDEDVENPGETTEMVIADLRYAFDEYIGPDASDSRRAYLRYNNRPVIFIFPKNGNTDWSRVRQAADGWEEKPLLLFKDVNPKYANAFDGFYAWVRPSTENWSPDDWGQQYLDAFYARMTSQYPGKLAVGAAWPGFDDSRAAWTKNRHMASRCGRTLEDSLRMFRRYYTPEKPLPFLLIVTWNDYEEGTAIERAESGCNPATTTDEVGARITPTGFSHPGKPGQGGAPGQIANNPVDSAPLVPTM